jgi:hypothetical protein
MAHVPTATSVAVVPLTVHTVGESDEKPTGRPDEAAADKKIGEGAKSLFPGEGNVTVWVACPTLKPWLALGAAL